MVPDGIEPPALALLVPRSNQLSYGTEREGATERERKGEGTTSLMWASNVELNRSPTSLTSGTPHLILCVSFGIFGSTSSFIQVVKKREIFFFPLSFLFFSSLSSNFSFFHCKSV